MTGSKICNQRSPINPRILVAEDDRVARHLYRRMLESEGYAVVTVPDGHVALNRMRDGQQFDVVIADIHMPCMSGIKLLQEMRSQGIDASVVLVTAGPSIQTAIHSVELSAFRYLTKPFPHQTLVDVITEATVAARKRMKQNGEKRELQCHLNQALDQSWIAFEPILNIHSGQTWAFQARLRTASSLLPTEVEIRAMARTLGVDGTVDARARARLVDAIVSQRPPGAVVKPLSKSELRSRSLYEPGEPLSIHADRMVLELDLECSLEDVSELDERLDRLKNLGFRLGLSGLGTGHGDLTHLATWRPDVVKVARSLVRGIECDDFAQAIVRSLLELTESLDSHMIAADVETEAERDTLIGLGVSYLQGPLICCQVQQSGRSQ